MTPKLFTILSLAFAFAATSQVRNSEHDYSAVEVGSTTYTLEHRWTRPDWINETKMGSGNTFFFTATKQPDQFFVCDGFVYVNKVTMDGSHTFLKVDGATGEPLTGVELDMSGYANSEAATYYSGNDSYGTPYVAACAIFGNPSYPMTISTVEVGSNGALSIGRSYELPVKGGISGYTQAPGVYGDLDGGEFVVACPVWPEYNLTKDGAANTKLAIWEVSGTSVDFSIYDIQLSVCDVVPLGNSLLLIHDSGVYRSASTPDYPTLYRYGGKKLDPVGRLDAQAMFNDTDGNGVAVIHSLGESPVLVYASGGSPATYSSVVVPDLATGFDRAMPLWHFAGGSSFADSLHDRISNRTTIVKEELDGKTARIYMLSHHKSLASYAITAEEKTSSIDVVATTSCEAEYYTLTGLRVARPTVPGLYIVREGANTRKMILK